MTNVSSKKCRAIRRDHITLAAAISAVVGLALIPLSAAQADWESEYSGTSTYWGLQGNIALPNFGSQIGQSGSRPNTGVTNVSDVNGGLRLFFGYRVHPYIAWEVAAEWTGGVTFDADAGSEDIDIFTGSVHIKGYPLAKVLDTAMDGRIQPYIYLAPGIAGAMESSIKTAIHFNLGIGGGVEYWLNDSWTVHVDGKYSWSFGNLEGLDYTTIGVGGAYHF